MPMLIKAKMTRQTFEVLICGLAALVTIGGLGLIGQWAETPLLMAPLGASAVLLFAAPESPLARPRNQIGGHMIAAMVGLLAIMLPYEGIWVCAAAVAVTVMLMMIFGVEHPPAGAVPLVMILGKVEPGFVLGPVLCGTVFLGLITQVFYRFKLRRARKVARA